MVFLIIICEKILLATFYAMFIVNVVLVVSSKYGLKLAKVKPTKIGCCWTWRESAQKFTGERLTKLQIPRPVFINQLLPRKLNWLLLWLLLENLIFNQWYIIMTFSYNQFMLYACIIFYLHFVISSGLFLFMFSIQSQ